MASVAPLRGEDILGQAIAARGAGSSQATVIEQSRAIAEVQGALVVAHQRPRDKMRALNEALESCRTKEVAESAFFKFSRGGKSVGGESIHLARELARCWGNIIYTVAELDRDDVRRRSEMVAFAWDLETNAQSRLSFIVPHMRDKTGGAVPLSDMRDIYENNANMGARRLRECIFAVLPPYLTKAAAEQCHLTLQGGNDEKPLPVRIAEALTAFESIGINKDRIEAKLGPVGKFTPVDYANLRVSFASIKRNEIEADEEFPRIDALTGAALLDQARTDEPEISTAAGNALPAEAEPPNVAEEAAASAQPSLAERMAAVAEKSKAPVKEGRADADMGEQTTLESAKAEVDAAEFVPDVNSRTAALLPLLGEEDADALRNYAMDRIAALSPPAA